MKLLNDNNISLDSYAQYADESPVWSAPFGLKLLDSINYKTGITVLDIGTGTGFPLTEIALRLGGSATLYGIDPWHAAVERTREKLQFFGITNTSIIEGFAESIPLHNGSVDLITSNNGLNNVNDYAMVLSECRRVLKPGGQFLQTMNLEDSMTEFYSELEIVLAECNLHDSIIQLRKHIRLKRRPLDESLSLIESSGFAIKNVVHDSFAYRFSNGTAMLNHYFIRLAFMPSWIEILPDDKAEEIFAVVETRLNEKSAAGAGMKLSIPFVLIEAEG